MKTGCGAPSGGFESESDLMAWRFNRKSDAFLPMVLAFAHIKSIFHKPQLVEKDSPMDLVDKEIQGVSIYRGLIK